MMLKTRAARPQEMIYNHFLQSKENKKIESGKQSKVLPAINGACRLLRRHARECAELTHASLAQRSRSCATTPS